MITHNTRLSKWQILNLQGSSSSKVLESTHDPILQSFTGVSEATVPFPDTWGTEYPDVFVFRDGMLVNQNMYRVYYETSPDYHVRIVFSHSGDYVVKLRA